MLRAQLGKALGDFSLDVSLEISSGSTLVLVGESGSGKTTALRLLAGLLDPDSGRVAWNDDTWYDGRGAVATPSWRRPIGYVAQDYSLFPHLTAFENVAFGLPSQRGSGGERRARVSMELERFGISSLAKQKPHQLSGGQQQRVALARALILNPSVLLLDEPLTALDLTTRRATRMELRGILRTLTCATLFVTHSPLEAMVFGDRIAVLEKGRVIQAGSRDDLLRRPRSAFIAEFMGVNLFQGTIIFRDGHGLARLSTAAGELSVVDPGDLESEVFVSVSPREITLHRERPGGSAQNVFRGIVSEIIPEPPHGERVRVAINARPPLVAEVTRAAVDALQLQEGSEVYAAFKATGLEPYG